MFKKIWNAVKAFLEPVNKFMSSIVNFILLSLVYAFGIGPVSLISKLFGNHFLALKKQNKSSNWQEHRVEKQPLEKYFRTF